MIETNRLTLSERSHLSKNPTAKRIFQIMDKKKTNLAVSVEPVSSEELLLLADLLGPEICVLKTHIDILKDFSSSLIGELRQIAERHDFVLFEDRKFADIGTTVMHQYRDGIYRISDWAQLTNAHMIPGPGVIEGLREVGLPKGNGMLLVAEMSSSGNLAIGAYTQESVEMAYKFDDFVIGFICQRKLTNRSEFIHMTPGVSLVSKGDSLGQRYLTPEIAIKKNGADVIIVGRGITEASDPLATARLYRAIGFNQLHM